MYKHFQFKIVSIIHFKNLILIHKFILHLIITLKYCLCRDCRNDCIYYKAIDFFVTAYSLTIDKIDINYYI